MSTHPLFIGFQLVPWGVEIATPLIVVTFHYLFIGFLVVGVVGYRRQVVRVRREMRARQAARRGVLTAGK